MAKTNFTKVEEALAEGLRKITVTKLLEEADEAGAGKEDSAAHMKEHQDREAAHALILTLQLDLKELSKNDQGVYTKFGIKKKELKKMISNPESLNPQDWEKLKKLRSQIDDFKKDMSKNLPPSNDETLIEQERYKHLNKRFNVKDKWIPLQ